VTRTATLSPAVDRPAIVARPAEAPDPERLIAAVARAVLEAEVGRRPLRQLETLVASAVLNRLSARDDEVRRQARVRGEPLIGPGAVAVLRVWSQAPAAHVREGGALVRRGERVVSLAMRVERQGDGWRVVDLDRPEDATRRLRRRGSA
jgi:hypothetical protein